MNITRFIGLCGCTKLDALFMLILYIIYGIVLFEKLEIIDFSVLIMLLHNVYNIYNIFVSTNWFAEYIYLQLKCSAVNLNDNIISLT